MHEGRFTGGFVQDRPKDGQAVIYGGTVPPAAPELMLALLDAQLHTFCYAGHDLDVIAAEAQLLGDQAWDGAAEQRLGGQRCVLLAQGQGPPNWVASEDPGATEQEAE